MSDGTRVTGAEQWFQQRRPELIRLFEQNVYGVAPVISGISAQVRQSDPTVFDGAATLTEVEIAINGLPEYAPRIHLALFTPNQRNKPVPVFLGMNALGNYATVAHETVRHDPQAWANPEWKGHGRGGQAQTWCVENSIRRGYALATVHTSDIDADRPDPNDGFQPFYSAAQLGCSDAERWGTIRAWAWGLQRCIDYLVTDARIDPARIGVIGHSRLGKTALLTAALDTRVALVVPHQSGTGGCALSRDNDQETVQKINDRFPHWFNDVFKTFNGREAELPVDQHELIALVAPRALLDTEGERDAWASPNGAWRALQAAAPVWTLLGQPGLLASAPLREPQSPNDAGGAIAQYRRDTEHVLDLGYWNAALDFADRIFGTRNGT